MPRVIGIGNQDFGDMIRKQAFYIDKTRFIREWWENQDKVTLITRPRRFGKTLTVSMVEQFFSVNYRGQGELFAGLDIWKDPSYHSLQGTYPVISLSFANVKETNYQMTRERIYQLLVDVYNKNAFLVESGLLTEEELKFFRGITMDMSEVTATMSVHKMSDFLSRYYQKNIIILLDEYDTPMQEAYVDGYWDELTAFSRSLFNATFKTNPYLERAIMTGITRVSKESVFSDLNNLAVVTTTSRAYADCFGFTEQEVFDALDEYGLGHRRQVVKEWYDGFTFGSVDSIYNPWSVINFLKYERVAAYWANTSSNSLAGKLIREGNKSIKMGFEDLMNGKELTVDLDEQVIFSQLDSRESAVWSLLLASGYLKAADSGFDEETRREKYRLKLTNEEVRMMFEDMISGWFSEYDDNYNDFIKALLVDDVDAMNIYMNRVALSTFSFFDTGRKPSGRAEPERFYHGFVLGLMVELGEKYEITSNRESGFGRYDVMLEPKKKGLDAIILEFKVRNPGKEQTLKETVEEARRQITEKGYAKYLMARGMTAERIRTYGFAFEGKKVLIG